MAIDKTYFKGANESIDQYNTRISEYNASKTPAAPAPKKKGGTATTLSETGMGGSNTSAFMSELQSRLLGQADIISSEDTSLEDAYKKSVEGINTSQQKSAERITSQFDREKEFAKGEQASSISQLQEGQRGFGVQMPALRRLVETTDKEIKDLETRKQELILAGESDAAKQISDLQFKKLQFAEDKKQQVFQNLLGLGNFASSQETNQRLAQDSAQKRIDFLRENGTLSAMPDDQKSALESEAGLPAGVLAQMGDLPPNYELRSVGDMLVAVDPKTLKTTVLYNGTKKDSEGVNIGGTKVSYMTSSIINGLQNLRDLTATEQQKAVAELDKLGFNSDKPPAWYVDKLSSEKKMSFIPQVMEEKWQSTKNKVLFGGDSFLNQDFFKGVYGTAGIESAADEAGVDSSEFLSSLDQRVQAYRKAGFNDQEILKLMSK